MAQGGAFKDLVNFFLTDLIYPATYLILGAAVVFFMWNMMQVIRNSDNPEELAKFKDKAVWGVVAIFVMVSLWGLVSILTTTFFGGSGNLPIPLIQTGATGGSLRSLTPPGRSPRGGSGTTLPGSPPVSGSNADAGTQSTCASLGISC